MKRFIRYLYEYEQGRRTRNVGFVKVEQKEHTCVVHVHGKGFRLGAGSRLWLSLFFREAEGICLVKRREETQANPALNSQIAYTEEEFEEEGFFPRICGVALENDAQKLYLAVWDDAPVNLANIRMWEREEAAGGTEGGSVQGDTAPDDAETADAAQGDTTPDDAETADAGQPGTDVPASENEGHKERVFAETERLAGNMQPEPRKASIQTDLAAAGIALSGQGGDQGSRDSGRANGTRGAVMSETMRTQRMNMEGNARRFDIREKERQKTGFNAVRSEGVWMDPSGSEKGKIRVQNIDPGIPKPAWSYRKIQRSQLTSLARHEWRLANNQFLMHGYRNYRHLLLLERNGKWYLGVPGIYHRREAQAAETFGFPEFIGVEEIQIHLPDEERQAEAFGYWIRPVRKM